MRPNRSTAQFHTTVLSSVHTAQPNREASGSFRSRHVASNRATYAPPRTDHYRIHSEQGVQCDQAVRCSRPIHPSIDRRNVHLPPHRRRQLNPRACCNAVAVAIAPVALQPPRGLRGATPRQWSAWWRRRGDAAVCCASAHVSAETVQWVSVGAAVLLTLAKGTAVNKSFLVPFVALQAPSHVITWIKGDHGQWTAFLGLLLRLLYFIPGELELPLSTMLFVSSIAPHQFMNLRGTRDSAILSLAIAAYLAFQHFTGAGSLRKAFDRGAIVATLSIICITLIPLLFFF